MPTDNRTTDQIAADAPRDPGHVEDKAGGLREGLDAEDVQRLKRDPSDEDAKLDVALDETFPGSDAPSNTQPGKGKDPAPSTGFDPDEERQQTGSNG
ncbi:hypothetical protein [Sphingomonas jatrophae]|uniref:Uncharacterized protein n=1 Tax=Sphingomonas jatrophae TaxID=1166337 RepID=A0A1I6LBZ0_9SPHN|nr:hypothetical protein [Sphingomonas jatrophae]SFS00996.1 hypothetical protein SAMN05192580_2558 [Sphingomonas jatrophae]